MSFFGGESNTLTLTNNHKRTLKVWLSRVWPEIVWHFCFLRQQEKNCAQAFRQGWRRGRGRRCPPGMFHCKEMYSFMEGATRTFVSLLFQQQLKLLYNLKDKKMFGCDKKNQRNVALKWGWKKICERIFPAGRIIRHVFDPLIKQL